MESTGIYWVPLFELRESRGLAVYLVQPRQARHAPGRPRSDVLDCQWLQRPHSYGLLTASFRPAEQVVVLRGYLRQRQRLLRYAAQHVQHMHKALEQMNVKLTEVVSDVTGLTGRAIIQAILAGERDPRVLARLLHVNGKRTEAEIARALQGTGRAEHLFALRQPVALDEFYGRPLKECDAQLRAQREAFADRRQGRPRPTRSRPSRKRPHGPAFDVGGALYRLAGVDLTVLEGIDEVTALVILGEVGPDVSRFATAKQFTSWLGLWPAAPGLGGKSPRPPGAPGEQPRRPGVAEGGAGLPPRQARAGGLLPARPRAGGGPKALVATARKLAERVWRLLRYGAEYVCQEVAAYEAAYRERLVKGLARKARELGYRLEPAAGA